MAASDRRVDAAVVDAVRAAGAAEEIVTGPEVADALARRDTISLEFPGRPTWIGDRWRSGTLRVRRAYDLNIAVVWPRMWTVPPEHLRTDTTVAQSAYVSATSLVGWAVVYGALGVPWWPALLVDAMLFGAGVVRARTATTALCDLVETAAGFYGATLADQLGKPHPALSPLPWGRDQRTPTQGPA